MFLSSARLRGVPPDDRIDYPFGIPAVRYLDELAFPTRVTFFVGENGSGKSTLLEALAAAYGLNPEGGPKHIRFATRASHSGLHQALQLTKRRPAPTDTYFLRAETFYNVATAIENPADYATYDLDAFGGRSLHHQSHGEAFLALVTERLRGNGLYLFDEPEAALSPSRQLALMVAMHALERANSQFIVATHSPILLAYPGATIYQFGEHPVRTVRYEETEHYQVTKAFLERPERMLRELFADAPERDTVEP